MLDLRILGRSLEFRVVLAYCQGCYKLGLMLNKIGSKLLRAGFRISSFQATIDGMAIENGRQLGFNDHCLPVKLRQEVIPGVPALNLWQQQKRQHKAFQDYPTTLPVTSVGCTRGRSRINAQFVVLVLSSMISFKAAPFKTVSSTPHHACWHSVQYQAV